MCLSVYRDKLVSNVSIHKVNVNENIWDIMSKKLLYIINFVTVQLEL